MIANNAYQRLVDYLSTNPATYNLIHIGLLFGLPYVRTAKLIDSKPGDRILDLACGPAQILSKLDANCHYIGIDENTAHIKYAQKRYNGRQVRFIADNVMNANFEVWGPFDKVLMLGFLHHLPDDAIDTLLELVAPHMRGRLITFDPVRTSYHPISNLLCSMDRGNHVRTAEDYKALLSKKLRIVKSVVFPARSLMEMFMVNVCEAK